MIKSLYIPLLALITLSALEGCAATGERETATAADIDYHGSDCILIPTIRDYRELDDRNLLIYGAANRPYFVTLFRPSFELRSSFQLGFSSLDDQLCPFGGDRIVVGSLNREAVRIQAISRVSEQQAEQLLVRYGKKKPAEQPAPAPGKVKGADVEELG
ncbi:MAG TPA: DUF6491 family protein [Woeseiaceae bacterium]|nr:DUF6491 family protein [Woeseiaceae bacterium]